MSRPIQNRRVLSGMRPTGMLHLGNYHGALKNWIELQYQYECYFFIADWHALTTGYEDTSQPRGVRLDDGDRLAGGGPESRGWRRCSSSRRCPSTRSCTCCCR